MKRTTKWGHWKTTGNDKTVVHENQTVGYRRTLIFHEGRAPQGTRTDWVMYEYRLGDEVLPNIEIDKVMFVLLHFLGCEIYFNYHIGWAQ